MIWATVASIVFYVLYRAIDSVCWRMFRLGYQVGRVTMASEIERMQDLEGLGPVHEYQNKTEVQ